MSKKLIITIFLLLNIPVSSQDFWSPVSPLTGSDFVQAMTVTQNGTIIAASWYVGIYRSTNNGVSWSQRNSSRGVYELSTAPDGAVFALHYTTTSINVSRSTDDGLTWGSVFMQPNSANFAYGGGIAFLPGGVYVASLTETIGPLIGNIGVVIIRSTNAGLSWSQILLEQGSFFGNFVTNSSRTTIFAAVNGVAYPSVIYSVTQGSSWISSTIFGGGGECIARDANDNLYIGVRTADNVTEKLYKSTDGALTWNPGNLPGESVLSLFVASNGVIYAGTDIFSGPLAKVRRSTNNSASWQMITSGLPQGERVYSFTENSSGDIFAGSRSTGIYKHSNLIGIHNINTDIPKAFSLGQNYPNPFNPTTHFEFRIADFGLVRITIYNAIGEEIEKLLNQELSPGTYKTEWNAANYPSGIYFYKLEAVEFTETKKMLLVK
jgi:hypothetical protein